VISAPTKKPLAGPTHLPDIIACAIRTWNYKESTGDERFTRDDATSTCVLFADRTARHGLLAWDFAQGVRTGQGGVCGWVNVARPWSDNGKNYTPQQLIIIDNGSYQRGIIGGRSFFG
jgi:hypothetical protein